MGTLTEADAEQDLLAEIVQLKQEQGELWALSIAQRLGDDGRLRLAELDAERARRWDAIRQVRVACRRDEDGRGSL